MSSDNIWQRLADAIVQPHATATYTEQSPLVVALRKLAAEDAEREGHLGCDHAAGECIPDALNVGKKPAALPNLDDTYADGSPAYRPKGLPPHDPALVEECVNLYWGEGDDKQSMERVLTHYRERVEGPLREQNARWSADCSAWYDNYEEMRKRAVAAEDEADRLRGELADMEKRKDGAYEERNRVVALLAALYPSKRCRTAIEGWSDDWHGCVYIETPEGQLSWHYHDSQASMFAHVPEGAARWDGHTTEEKYRRVDRLCVNAAPAQRFTQPTDEERQRLADMARYYGGQGASSLVYVRADDMRRIATLLEQPAPAPARKSIGRTFYGKDATLIECDLVPVGEEKP